MTLLSWRDDYRIGIKDVDTEHKFLFDLINAVHDSHTSAHDRKDVLTALTRLVAYAERHFTREEAMMAAQTYPKLDHHRQLHEHLYSSIFDLNEKLQSGARHVDAEVLRFLKNWLVDHILHEDMDFGSYTASAAAKAKKSAAEPKEAGEGEEGPTA
jgi:hemerythrin